MVILLTSGEAPRCTPADVGRDNPYVGGCVAAVGLYRRIPSSIPLVEGALRHKHVDICVVSSCCRVIATAYNATGNDSYICRVGGPLIAVVSPQCTAETPFDVADLRRSATSLDASWASTGQPDGPYLSTANKAQTATVGTELRVRSRRLHK